MMMMMMVGGLKTAKLKCIRGSRIHSPYIQELLPLCSLSNFCLFVCLLHQGLFFQQCKFFSTISQSIYTLFPEYFIFSYSEYSFYSKKYLHSILELLYFLIKKKK